MENKRLFVPELGTILSLSKDWYFKLYNESRNYMFGQKYDPTINKKRFNGWYFDELDKLKSMDVVLVAGTNIKLDRIYVRKGQKDYSSLSFHIVNGMFKGSRFWAKLSDCNNIEFDTAIVPVQKEKTK